MTMSADVAPTPPATIAAPETAVDAPAGDYAAMKAAAEEAMGQPDEGAPTPPAPKPAGEAPKMGDDAAAPAEAAAEADDGLPKIAKLLKAREAARALELTSKNEAATIRQQAEKDAADLRRSTLESAKAEAAAWLKETQAKLRANPLGFINESGIDREQLVNEVAKSGSPEYQLIKRLEAQVEAANKRVEAHEAKWTDAEKRAAAREEQAQQHAIKSVEAEFLKAVSVDSAPNLRKLYDEQEIVQKGHAVARRLREETGQDASLEDIRDYLEFDAKKRIESLGHPATAATATKKPANGTRTLTGKGQSERRATPKDYGAAKSPEEESAILQAAAEAAMRSQ